MVIIRTGKHSYLVALPVQLMDSREIPLLLTEHVKSSLDLATVGIAPPAAEDGSEQSNAVAVNGTIEGDSDHLGD